MAANITGTLRTTDGVIRANFSFNVVPLGAPFFYEGNLILSDALTVETDGNGDFEFDALPGFYRLMIEPDMVTIQVVEDTGDFTLEEVTVDPIQTVKEAVDSVVVSNVAQLAAVLNNTKSVKWSKSADPDATYTRIAMFGNLGADGSTLTNAAFSFTSSVNPLHVFSLGNATEAAPDAQMYDDFLGPWHSYIKDYQGGQGAGAVGDNRFWPAIGDHEYDPDLTEYNSFFSLALGSESEAPRYYKKTIGNIEFFVLDSNTNEPDGTSPTSVQAVWLQTQLAASTAIWKIVCFHHSPYSSQDGYAAAQLLNWQFSAWGASMVIASGAKVFERITVSSWGAQSIPLYVVGNFDEDAPETYTPLPSSQFQHNTSNAGLVLDVSAYGLTVAFVGFDGAYLDGITYLAPDTVNKLFAYTPVKKHGGIKVGDDGHEIDFGINLGQVTPNDPYSLTFGKIIRSLTSPDVSAYPMYESYIWMKPGGQPRLHTYNEHLHAWIDIMESASYDNDNDTVPRLSTPVLTPANGEATNWFEVSGGGASTQLYYSIGGGAFIPCLDGARIIFPKDALRTVAVYQRNDNPLEARRSEILVYSYAEPTGEVG